MNYREIQPSPPFAELVKCFWSLEYDGAGSQPPEPVIPDGRVEIIFNLSDSFHRYHSDGVVETQPASIIAGQIERPVMIGPSGKVCLFGIRFRPAGAFPFFGFEMSELAERIEPLDAVWGKSVYELEDRLFNANVFEDRIAAAEAYLSKLVRPQHVDHTVVLRSVGLISAASGRTRVRDLSRLAGISERGLERRFRKYIGLTPKAFSRICRFQSVLRSLESAGGPDILNAAHDFGYYDQSHLISDFRQYLGLTPTVFWERSTGLTELFIASE